MQPQPSIAAYFNPVLEEKEKKRKQVYLDRRGIRQVLGNGKAGDVISMCTCVYVLSKRWGWGVGVCQVGERIIKRFVQNAEMKEEDENNNDKIRITLILFLSSVSCLSRPKKEEQSLRIFVCLIEISQSPMLTQVSLHLSWSPKN